MTLWSAVGAVLALLALGFVLLPIVRDAGARSVRETEVRDDPHEDAIAALREVEFDRATGKLSDDDYAALRSRYRPQALAQLGRESSITPATAPDPEAMIAAWRARESVCPSCGPRPETGATWCSSCGHYLPGACGRCRGSVFEAGASYCSHCGKGLAAA